jgi:hypothetical protein
MTAAFVSKVGVSDDSKVHGKRSIGVRYSGQSIPAPQAKFDG